MSDWGWQKKYVNTALYLKLVSSTNKKFFPDAPLTKVEALKMAVILFVWDINLSYSQKLIDVAWSEWFTKYIEYSVKNDLIPIINNFFYPNKYITRYEVIWLLYKISKK